MYEIETVYIVLSYDTWIKRVPDLILLTVSSKLRQYFDVQVEPLLHSNMEIGGTFA